MSLEKMLTDLIQVVDKHANNSTNTQRRFAMAAARAEKEQAILDYLDHLRSSNSGHFVKAFFKMVQSVPREKSAAIRNRYELTELENGYLILELRNSNDWTLEQTAKELGLKLPAKAQLAAEPTGEELLDVALNQLKREKPTWKPFQFRRFVGSRTSRHLVRPSKPFTAQDIAVGAEWYFNKRKSLKAERDQKILDHGRE